MAVQAKFIGCGKWFHWLETSPWLLEICSTCITTSYSAKLVKNWCKLEICTHGCCDSEQHSWSTHHAFVQLMPWRSTKDQYPIREDKYHKKHSFKVLWKASQSKMPDHLPYRVPWTKMDATSTWAERGSVLAIRWQAARNWPRINLQAFFCRPWFQECEEGMRSNRCILWIHARWHKSCTAVCNEQSQWKSYETQRKVACTCTWAFVGR